MPAQMPRWWNRLMEQAVAVVLEKLERLRLPASFDLRQVVPAAPDFLLYSIFYCSRRPTSWQRMRWLRKQD
jgi:hypothetical protein